MAITSLQPTIMFLGSYHMANPNQDQANLAADDVLTDARQHEISDTEMYMLESPIPYLTT